MDAIKQFIVDCIEQHRGDDLARAKLAVRGFSSQKMQEKIGQSDQTWQEILYDYQSRNDRCDEAIKFIKRLK